MSLPSFFYWCFFLHGSWLLAISATIKSRKTHEQILIDRLMHNYDPISRPVFNASKAVVVKFSLAFIQICDMEWMDERLVWNRSTNNSLKKIRIPCSMIWVCHFKFGSWTYSGLQVDLVNRSDEVDLSNYMKSGEWDLKKVTVQRNVIYYPCCPHEPFPDVTFHIYIRRRIVYYLINIIIPCIWLSLISVMTFWLPPDSGEKISLSITVLLAYSVFMLLIAENIPATSEMVPLISIYLTFTMSLTFLSIVLTVFVLQVHYATNFAPRVSRRLYAVFTRRVAPWMGMRNVVARFEKSQAKLEAKLRANSKIRQQQDDEDEAAMSQQQKHQQRGSRSRLQRDVDAAAMWAARHRTERHGRVRRPSPLVGQFTGTSGDYDDILCVNESNSPSPCKHLLIKNSSNSMPAASSSAAAMKHLIRSTECVLGLVVAGNQDESMDIIKNEWKLIALIVDRVLFWAFAVFTLVSSFFLLVVIPVVKNSFMVKDNVLAD